MDYRKEDRGAMYRDICEMYPNCDRNIAVNIAIYAARSVACAMLSAAYYEAQLRGEQYEMLRKVAARVATDNPPLDLDLD